MSHAEIIRAWKDEEYRAKLSAAELADAPQNPAGAVDVSGAAQHDFVGTGGSWLVICNTGDWMPCTMMICPTYLWQCQTGGMFCPILE